MVNAMFRSATFKLTLWYLALAMAISLAFSIVLYHVTTDELARGLHSETQRIFTQFPVFDDNPMLRPGPDISNATHRILLRLISFNAVVLFSAGIASYWLARRTLEPIQAAHEQQKRFTADVSHELRTPLTALKMESEVALMNKQTGKDELRNTLKSNLEEVTKLEVLINNLLRLSRLEVDELQQRFVKLSTDTIVDKALALVKPLAKDRNISFVSKVTDIPVMGDEDSLVQLLVILLDNAVKYSPHDSEVTISGEQKAGVVTIAVEDTGLGIEPEQLKHVFDRFYRADNSRSKSADSEGFGLGLSIAKMIADVHHGEILITSHVGKGTTASFLLPMQTAEPTKK